jgi:uncharacterized protein YecE (DUF72 family)
MKKKLWIGTSGYVYKDWRGIFYPEGLPQTSWFTYYSSCFSTVEINNSYYHLPSVETFKRWHDLSPPKFRFFVKGSRYLTQYKKLKDPREPLKLFFACVKPLKEKLAGVLWQFPPHFRLNADRLSFFLDELKRFPKTRHVFEFRHDSWFVPETSALLNKFGAAFCHADMPEFYKKMDVPVTAGFIYVRRHGPDLAQRYHHSYPEKAIKRDAQSVHRWLREGKEVYAYFNNDFKGAAIQDAMRLKSAVEC